MPQQRGCGCSQGRVPSPISKSEWHPFAQQAFRRQCEVEQNRKQSAVDHEFPAQYEFDQKSTGCGEGEKHPKTEDRDHEEMVWEKYAATGTGFTSRSKPQKRSLPL